MREVVVSLLFLPFLFVALAFLVLCLAFGVRLPFDVHNRIHSGGL
jgi:hypothetical protein